MRGLCIFVSASAMRGLCIFVSASAMRGLCILVSASAMRGLCILVSASAMRGLIAVPRGRLVSSTIVSAVRQACEHVCALACGYTKDNDGCRVCNEAGFLGFRTLLVGGVGSGANISHVGGVGSSANLTQVEGVGVGANLLMM